MFLLADPLLQGSTDPESQGLGVSFEGVKTLHSLMDMDKE